MCKTTRKPQLRWLAFEMRFEPEMSKHKEEVPPSQLLCSAWLFLQSQVNYKNDTKDVLFFPT